MWQDELLIMLRFLIGDFAEPHIYDDDRLVSTLVIAAKYVQQDVALDISYVVDIDTEEIDPDPMGDEVFATLIVLKAGCLLDQAKARDNARKSGVSVRVGPSSVALNTASPLYELLLSEGPCGLYDRAKFDFSFTNLKALRALVTPPATEYCVTPFRPYGVIRR